MPWPISECPEITFTVSSGAIRTKALGAKELEVAAARRAAALRSSGTNPAIQSPTLAEAVVFKKDRRPIRDATLTTASCKSESGFTSSKFSARLMICSFLWSFQLHGELHGECEGRCRSGRCCRPSLRRYLYLWVWEFREEGRPHS